MINLSPLPLAFLVDHIRRREQFSLVRFGDGEWNAIAKVKGKNCDGHTYFEDLGDALALTLTQPRTGNYFYCLGPKASRGMQSQVSRWLAAYAPALTFYDSEAMVNASVKGQLYPFVQALNHKRIVFVGGPHLSRLWEHGLMRQPIAHLITPTVNAWTARTVIELAVRREMQTTNPNRKPDVILFSAGMVSKVLIHQIAPELEARGIIGLDTGSLWDYACGVDSRSYARRMTTEHKAELVHANFAGSYKYAV